MTERDPKLNTGQFKVHPRDFQDKGPPWRVLTYCGCCHDTRAHYLKQAHCDDKRDCYECAGCNHLIFVPNNREWAKDAEVLKRGDE